MKTLTLMGLAAAVAAAGCIQFEDLPVDGQAVRDLASPWDPFVPTEAHDHADPAHHAHALNATQVFHDPVAPGVLREVGELDVRNGVLAQAILRPDAGVVLYDVSDPAHPVRKGEWATTEGYGADVKLSPDGKLAFVSTQPTAFDQLPVNPSLPAYGSLSPGIPGGVYVLDVSDLEHPSLLRFTAFEPRGVHMAYVHEIGGVLHLFAVHNRVGVSAWIVHPDGSLEPVGLYDVGDDERLRAAADLGLFPAAHDVTVQDAPDGRVLMNVPYGYWMTHLVDVTDPANPTLLGVWAPDDGNAYYLHTAMSAWRGDKRYTFVVPEVFGEGQADLVAPFWVLDSTDPAAITEVGKWTNPGGHGAANMRFSTHNFQLVGDAAYLAHYHGGVWKLDVSDPANPRTVGYFMPHEAPEMLPTGYLTAAYALGEVPGVWDVVVHEGYVYASDIHSGLYVLHFDGDPVGDDAYTGFA